MPALSRRSHCHSAHSAGSRLRVIGKVTTVSPMSRATVAIRASGGVTKVTRWPRSWIPRISLRTRISWPPQPQDDSV